MLAKQDQALLDQDNHMLVLIDHQPRVGMSAKPNHADPLRRNAVMVTKAAQEHQVPTLVTMIAEQPDAEVKPEGKSRYLNGLESDHTIWKPLQDEWITQWAASTGKLIVVLAGLRTSVSIIGSALMALDRGLLVYVVTDACGDVSEDAHVRALKHMAQQGAHPITSLQYLLELR